MKLSAIVSLFASFLILPLTPIQSLIWNGANSPSYLLKTQEFVSVFLRLRMDYAPHTSDYYFFGRMAILVYIGILFGLFELDRTGFFPAVSRKIFRSVLALFSIALFGDFIAYWGGNFFGESVEIVGFYWIEAPSIFLLSFAFPFLGFKMRSERKTEGIVFMILPFLMIASILFFRYVSSGFLFPISMVVTAFVLNSKAAPLFQKSSEVFLKFTSAKTVLVFFILAMICAGTMQILEKAIPISDGIQLPKKMDFRPFSTAQDFFEVFGVYGESGRSLYFWIDVVDMVFPFPLIFCFGGIYTKAAVRFNLPVSLNLFSYGFLVFDLLENSLMFYFLNVWPKVPEGIAAFTGGVTAVKLFFLFVGFFMFAVSFSMLVYRWTSEKIGNR
ncbi:hypothetical protein EHQ12_12470 [Leptospira gomenensis]|uniref:Uncharacterized protein n=1 Tax=Leptospira gomenensis TaxID=2484974 RepID=A0A5F1YNJ4_9LEPT|nr:hypothetical protein [Leptospira gomenensis]TGK32746.1 hypothetical protein EHQ17_12315 [Leptospira gomenensis]TGK36894.1 hypothetical protein EHQ12_12470 [Leptospira gomenensis]TGK44365.1 hypothetical protein EHQ07_11785 [Leptospira gomenensis]TGK58858.1 hypothetical protein EHQ13_13605 [Leptospira gomenensis]